MRQIGKAAILLLLSLSIGLLGGFAMRENYRRDLENWDFAKITAYQKARQKPDERLAALKYELRELEATVQGTVVLLFDQCSPNAYDVVYANLRDFDMAGSLVFRDVLPGDEGAITEEQWSEMRSEGWSAVLAASDDLIATLDEEDYVLRLDEYAEKQVLAFEAKGFPAPTAYAFAAGEFSEEAVSVLGEKGFTVFTSPDVETGLLGDNTPIFKESYMSSGPNAPLLQSHVESIKNTANVLVIKTRYVETIEDLTKDTELLKFRGGMLNSLSVYRGAGSLYIDSMENAGQIYLAELYKLAQVEMRRAELGEQITKTKAELSALWLKYRGHVAFE